jgi:hypothetical protein
MKFNHIVIAALASVTIVACGDKTASVASPVASGTQTANDHQAYPSRRDGLWEAVIDGGSLGKTIVTQCVDAGMEKAYAKDIWGVAQPNANCREMVFKKIADGFESSSICEANATTVKSVTTIKGDFQVAYTMDIAITASAANAPPQQSLSKFAATYKGPCPAGVKPGDMTTQPPGMPPQKINAYELLKLKKLTS